MRTSQRQTNFVFFIPLFLSHQPIRLKNAQYIKFTTQFAFLFCFLEKIYLEKKNATYKTTILHLYPRLNNCIYSTIHYTHYILHIHSLCLVLKLA